MLCHWDDVPAIDLARGDLAGRRRRLGASAGAPRLGLSRYDLGPGERPMPLHVHGDEEELLLVLEGAGLSVEREAAHPIQAGDVVFHPASGEPHTMVAGPEGMVVLAFGSGSDTGLTYLPRAKAMWAGPRWIPVDGPSPFTLEAQAGPLELPPVAGRDRRPATIVALSDVDAIERRRGDVGRLQRRLDGVFPVTRAGLNELSIDPGRLSAPPHCHTTEDELFVVLEGDGALELLDADGAAQSHPVHAGHVISLPAASGVSHAFGAGDGGLRLLAYGHRDPGDIAYYPRSGKVSIRGIDAIFRVQRVDYWEGEE
jgi:uncharacterized cupin superfamily protein